MPNPLFSPFVLSLLLGQGVHEDGPNNTFTVFTAAIASDGANFNVKAVATPIPAQSGIHNGSSAGPVSGTSSMYFQLSTGYENEFATGSESQSSTFKFYLAGAYAGSPTALPTSAAYSIPKTENAQAHVQAATSGNLASGSTSNTTASASGVNSTVNATPFSNTVTGTASSLGWQLQADGSYRCNYYLFENTISTSATYAKIGRNSAADASGKVTFSLGSLTASH
jgi:hypothetical protein